MKQYKLTEQEARALASQIAKESNVIHNPNVDYADWIKTYMSTYNRVMDAINSYNQSITD